MNGPSSLLSAYDMPPVTIINANGGSAFLIVADHAGNAIPGELGTLGLAAADRARHIAWDIGIAGVCRILSNLLDATLIQQNYSRLVIDCNRPPGTHQSIPVTSDGTAVPGNQALHVTDRQRREAEIFSPYHTRISAELDRRHSLGRPAILIAMHSFTPIFAGVDRPWHIGLLHHRDNRLAHALLPLLLADGTLTVGDNQPYDVGDATDWTIPQHGERRGLLHVGIEIRQDLITEPEGRRLWAVRLATLLTQAAQSGEAAS